MHLFLCFAFILLTAHESADSLIKNPDQPAAAGQAQNNGSSLPAAGASKHLDGSAKEKPYQTEGGTWRSDTARIDTPLPEGYPAPTAPGCLELKTYPLVRRAKVEGRGPPGVRRRRDQPGRCGGSSNLYFEKGKVSYKDLLSSNSRCLYITETIGHGSNIVTGDYSVGATGFFVENGEFQYPINEITIAGNFKDMFKNITLANDLEFEYSTNSPTMLIEGMVVAGK